MGVEAIRKAVRLVDGYGVMGFKFHPSLQRHPHGLRGQVDVHVGPVGRDRDRLGTAADRLLGPNQTRA